MTERERIVETALDRLTNEILYEGVDEDYLLEEFEKVAKEEE